MTNTNTDTEQKEQFKIPNEHPEAQSVGEQYREYGFLPGGYTCTCQSCACRFIGAKRSFSCLDCARKLEKDSPVQNSDTEHKEQFEGVRAGTKKQSGQKLPDGTYEAQDVLTFEALELGFQFSQIPSSLASEIARRWNAYPTLKSEMNELADKIVELEKSSNNSLDKLGGSNGKLLLACSNLSDKDAEITRLKEELDKLQYLKDDNHSLNKLNADLQAENERLKAYIEDDDKHKKAALEEIAGLASDYKNCQSQLSQAQERIKELETPDTCFANNDPMYGVDIKQSSNFANILKYEGCYDGELLQIWTAKLLKLHFCFFANDRSEVKFFDTLEEAEEALQSKGE